MLVTGPHLKPEWAWHHVQQLQAVLSGWESTYPGPYTATFEENDQRTERIYTATRHDPFPARVPLIIGDFVHA